MAQMSKRSRHAGDDVWVAQQIARNIEDDCGAAAFLDRRDIVAGDNFRRRVREEIEKCDELLALFTPWSRRRAWVRHEIGMADYLRKRIVCVFYKVTVADFRGDEDGLGPLDGLSTIMLVSRPENLSSSWMSYEAGGAEALGKRVMLLLPSKYPVAELPAEFASTQIVDLDPQASERAAHEVASRCRVMFELLMLG